MTKRHQAKYKIDRRMGQNIWGRPKSPINKREYGPGQHGQRRKGKLSDYGVQLRAKQKLKGYYANMSERHFHGVYDEARRLKGDTGANMVGLLERRLDTVIYRAKFVPTVFAARQFISHGHIKVNGKRVTIASYKVKVGDEIEVKEKSKQLALVLEANALARLHRSRPLQADGEDDPRTGAGGCALSGGDGAAPRRRILFALTPVQIWIAQKNKATRLFSGSLFYCRPLARGMAGNPQSQDAGALSFTAMPLSLNSDCNSPAWNISRMISQPPTNSPLT
jgi:small subunit ribosomal protein S4